MINTIDMIFCPFPRRKRTNPIAFGDGVKDCPCSIGVAGEMLKSWRIEFPDFLLEN